MPFRDLHEQMLNNVVQHSELLTVARGNWMPDAQQQSMYFLRRGSLSFACDEQAARIIKHDSPAARFPLPVDKRWKIHAGEPCEILQVPSRYLELDNALHCQNPDAIQLQEDDISGEVYLDFYHTLKSGQYDLPSLPDLAVRIGKAIDDPNTVNADIARLIQMDPSLTARVMSVVNSAAYGAAAPIRSLQQAVARLGRQQVRNLVFSCIIKGLFHTESLLLKKRMQQLWNHSCKVAAISFVLARVTPGLDPNRAMLAGLVHDIGAVPILHTARDMPQVNENAELLERIIDNLKAEIGPLTLLQWHFDDEMVSLTREAEHWHRIGNALPDYTDVVLVAQLHAFIGETANPQLPPIDSIPAFHKMALGQLTPRHSIGVLDHAAKDIAEVERILRNG